MKRKSKIENPIRNTVIFLALLGFCCSSSLFASIFFLSIASITFSSIIIETSIRLIQKTPTTTNSVSKFNKEKENAALRAQIDRFRMQVGQPTYTSQYGSTQGRPREVLPATLDDSRMPSSPKLSCP
jgi:hypothetical protein